MWAGEEAPRIFSVRVRWMIRRTRDSVSLSDALTADVMRRASLHLSDREGVAKRPDTVCRVISVILITARRRRLRCQLFLVCPFGRYCSSNHTRSKLWRNFAITKVKKKTHLLWRALTCQDCVSIASVRGSDAGAVFDRPTFCNALDLELQSRKLFRIFRHSCVETPTGKPQPSSRVGGWVGSLCRVVYYAPVFFYTGLHTLPVLVFSEIPRFLGIFFENSS